MRTIQLKIAQLRKQKGVTQRELAEFVGVSFQSISKWESEMCMPDILLLPVLAEYFDVSVDELLGLKPLKEEGYAPIPSDTLEYWSNKMAYLQKTRSGFWNTDYLVFLICTVWNITKPVDVIDFGCGYGSLGELLLPLLPFGSTYTGIDINNNLLNKAKANFKEYSTNVKFMECNLYDYHPDKKYDIAISQAVLRHLSDPKAVLRKMADSVVENGLVICIENNREFEQAGLLIDGLEYNPMLETAMLQKLWKTELEKQGRDYSIGMKLPIMMSDLGLVDVTIRMNDRMNYIHPKILNYDKILNDLLESRNWDQPLSDDAMEQMISHFMNRGINRGEAEAYIQNQLHISKYIRSHKSEVSILQTYGLLISYGKKAGSLSPQDNVWGESSMSQS